jgi:hypothetical protein
MFPRTSHANKKQQTKNVNKKDSTTVFYSYVQPLHEDLRVFVRVSQGQLAKYLLPRKLFQTKFGNKNETQTLCLIHVPESLPVVEIKRSSMRTISNVYIFESVMVLKTNAGLQEVRRSLSAPITMKWSLIARGFRSLHVHKFKHKLLPQPLLR